MLKHLPVLFVIFVCDAARGQAETDLLLLNGRIHTMTPDRSVVEAVAISDGRIQAVVSIEQLDSLRESASKVIDLGGQAVFPGFTDAHVHPMQGGATLLELSFTDQDDATRVQHKLTDYMATPTGSLRPAWDEREHR